MWAQVSSVATLSTILVLSVSKFHDYGEITNGVQWRVPHWALSLAYHGYGITSLWLDHHVALWWLVECRMTRVRFQSLNECCLLCLNVAGICRHQWTYSPPLLILKVTFKIPQSFDTVALPLLVSQTWWPDFRHFTCCLWAKRGGHTSGISHVMLFVTFWLAEAAHVIGNLEPSIGYWDLCVFVTMHLTGVML